MRTGYRHGLRGFFMAATLSTSGAAVATPPCEPMTYTLTLESATIDGQPVAADTSFTGGIWSNGGGSYFVQTYDPDTTLRRSFGVLPFGVSP